MPITDQGMTGKPGGDTGNPGIAIPPPPLKKAKGKKGEIKLNPVPKKLKDIVDISPKTEYQPEAKETHGVMTFGRMNPPTTGHEKLIHATHKVAQRHGSKAHIVLSHSHDKKNNPLPQKHKINYVKKIHPGVHVTGSSKESPSFLHHAKKLHQAGHDHLHVVAGSDRTGEYKKVLNKYNGHKDHYNFKSITVHSAGQRDPDSEGTSGISGTKMRAHAKSGDHKSFKAGLPKSLHKHHKEISSHISEAYEDVELLEWFDTLSDDLIVQMIDEDYIQEELVNERVMTLLQRRKAGIKMRRLKFRIQRARKMKKKRMATKDMLVRRARRQARTLIRKRLGGAKGANYSKLSPSERIQLDKRVSKKLPIINKIAIRLLPRVKSAELKRLSAARGKKNESVNHSFERFIADVVHEGTSEDNNRWSFQEYIDNTSTGLDEAESAQKLKLQSDKHKEQDKTLDKRQDLAKERLKVRISKQKSAEIRSEALTVAETVDMMIEAIEAIDAKAIKASIDPDTLFLEYIEGYENPHGKQTAQQGGFAAVNRLVAEMSQAQKDKAEDIVKGMKKKASDFTKRYGDKGEQVMYATANKLAQEDYKSLKSFGKRELLRGSTEDKFEPHMMYDPKTGKGYKAETEADHIKYKKMGYGHDKPSVKEGKGLWANIHAKRKRGEKMNPKGHKDAPTPAEMKKAQNENAMARLGLTGTFPKPMDRKKAGIKVDRSKFASIKNYKVQSGKKVDYDALMLKRGLKQRKTNEAFEQFVEAVGAAYMPDAGAVGTPEREITSKAVKKQINRSANRSKMKGKVKNAEVRYVQDRDRKTDLTAADKKKKKKQKGDTHDKIHKTKKKDKKEVKEGGNQGWEAFRKRVGKDLRDKVVKGRKADKSKVKQHDNKEIEESKMTSKESLNNWEHQDAVKVADMMIKEYGQPDEVTETMIKWKKLGDFGSGEQETYIVDESIPHDFPEPHRDFLYTSKKIKVPTKVGDTLLHVTGSIIVDGLKETVTARCGSLNANALTLGFVEDLAKGKVVNNKDIAKREYAKRINEGPLPSWYTDKLEKHMPKDQQEQTHMCGCLMTEAKDDKNSRASKMTQLFRMGLAKKGELELMKRAMKRGPDALKDPKLRGKLYELLQKLIGIVTTDGQIFVKLRQNVQNSKDELQAVDELFKYMSNTIVVQDIDLVNAHFEDLLESININEDMSGMSVKSGHKRSVDSGAGMTKKGVAAYKRRNPGSTLKTAVTTPPSKLKAGSKAAGRRKAFCSRSRSWDGERGKAARKRWNC